MRSRARTLRRLASETRGAQLVEYLLLTGAMVVAALVGARAFGITLAAKTDELAGCVRTLNGSCQPGPGDDSTSQIFAAGGESPRMFMQSDPSADFPLVTTLPSTGTGPDPAGAARMGRPMTVDEATSTLAPLTDPDVADDYAIFLTAFGGPPLTEELEVFAPGGPFTAVLTNPLYVFTDASGVTSYFGLVDGNVIQIDFDSDGELLAVRTLDDYAAVMWLCEAGNPEACIAEAEMLARAARDDQLALLGLELAVGLTPLGVVLDVRDAITSCPTDPLSFDCGSALIGFIPLVPGQTDEVADVARAAERAGTSSGARFSLTWLGNGQWQSPAGLIYGVDPNHGNRVRHVLAHTRPDSTKPMHTVFDVPPREVLPLVDEAWLKRGDPVPGDPDAYIVDMGRPVGTNGETAIKIVVRPGTSEIITAYPVALPDPPEPSS